jgi:hypothetical protein
MAMYAARKRSPVSHQGIEHIQGLWREAMAKARRIYIIGARVLPADGHIWDSLVAAEAPIFYVGREPDTFRDWAHGASARSTGVLAETFAEALPVLRKVIGR